MRIIKLFRNLASCALLLLLLSYVPSHASPWIEATDPFLRSNLQYLVSKKLLTVPTSTYPLPWRLIGHQLQAIELQQLSVAEQTAFDYVYHFYHNAVLNRGSKKIKAVAAESQAFADGYAPFAREQYGLYSSYEVTKPHYSYRVSANYSDGTDSNMHLNSQESYVTFSVLDVTVALGLFERWWGNGWGSALAWSQHAMPIPTASFNWQFAENSFLGYGMLESLVGKLDNDENYRYLWATRVTSQRQSWLELSASYQATFAVKEDQWTDAFIDVVTKKEEQPRRQSSLEAKFFLPAMAFVSPTIYGSLATTETHSLVQSYLVGMDAQAQIFANFFHFIVEYQNKLRDYQPQSTTAVFSLHKERALSTAHLADHLTLGALLQLSNDHAVQVYSKHYFPEDGEKHYQTADVEYRFQMQDFMITFGLNLNNNTQVGDKIRGWFGFEWRL